jgi:hypothetical protein
MSRELFRLLCRSGLGDMTTDEIKAFAPNFSRFVEGGAA